MKLLKEKNSDLNKKLQFQRKKIGSDTDTETVPDIKAWFQSYTIPNNMCYIKLQSFNMGLKMDVELDVDNVSLFFLSKKPFFKSIFQ